MARQKTVFAKDEVAHIWMAQTQDEGRTSDGRLFFEGKTIYSYGRHYPIATLVDSALGQVALYNDRNASPTTSKHQSEVRRALSVPAVPVLSFDITTTKGHAQNLSNLLVRLDNYVAKQVRTRTTDYTVEARRLADAVDSYLRYFPTGAEALGEPSQSSKLAGETIAQQVSRARFWDITPEERAVFLARQDAHQAAHPSQYGYVKDQADSRDKFEQPGGRKEQWVAGTLAHLGRNEQYWLEQDGGVRLQYLEASNEVHTSKGAYVPADDAKKLLRLLRTVKARGTAVRPENLKIGYYTVNSISAAGDLVAGCHTIRNTEIERFAQYMNWE
jgi:hypothetical protein